FSSRRRHTRSYGDWSSDVCSSDLAEALTGIDGIFLKRRQIFRDKWIRYGGYYPKYLLKMFRRERAHTDPGDLVDHHFYVTGKVRSEEGRVGRESRVCDVAVSIEMT